jgi:hypothetical protein
MKKTFWMSVSIFYRSLDSELTNSLTDLITIDDEIIIDNVSHGPYDASRLGLSDPYRN